MFFKFIIHIYTYRSLQGFSAICIFLTNSQVSLISSYCSNSEGSLLSKLFSLLKFYFYLLFDTGIVLRPLKSTEPYKIFLNDITSFITSLCDLGAKTSRVSKTVDTQNDCVCIYASSLS